jgi:sporulation protein YlmC with PRC-barrel domain
MSSKLYRAGDVQGKLVIETSGNRLGKAKEIAFSLDGTTTLFLEKDDGSEAQVPTSRLVAIGEFVVVRSDAPQVQVAGAYQAPPPPAVVPPPPPTPVCRSCGAPLKPNAKFCTKCGTGVA